MKFGCCTKAENYRALAACGYDFIELSGHEVRYMEQAQWLELVQEIHRTGVPCIGFNDYCHQQPAIVGGGFDPEAVRDYAQRLWTGVRSSRFKMWESAHPQPAGCLLGIRKSWRRNSAAAFWRLQRRKRQNETSGCCLRPYTAICVIMPIGRRMPSG